MSSRPYHIILSFLQKVYNEKRETNDFCLGVCCCWDVTNMHHS